MRERSASWRSKPVFYDLGRMRMIPESVAWLIIFAGLLGSLLVVCLMLSVCVRIGDLIIGW